MRRGQTFSRWLPLLLGLAGGLGFGLVLSRQAHWASPVPWLVYALSLVLLSGLAAWWRERRRL